MKPLLRFAEFVRAHYQTIILAAVIVGLGLGMWTTVPGCILQSAA